MNKNTLKRLNRELGELKVKLDRKEDILNSLAKDEGLTVEINIWDRCDCEYFLVNAEGEEVKSDNELINTYIKECEYHYNKWSKKFFEIN